MYNILIIGAGKIVSGYNDSSEEFVLTHLMAIRSLQPDANVYVYDVDAIACSAVCRKWLANRVECLTNVRNQKFDIILIATPDSTHAFYLEYFSHIGCLVICEKPLSMTKKEFQKTLAVIEPSPNTLLVNYSREFSGFYRGLKAKVRENKFGVLKNVVVRYGKGLLHNGSHAIHLLNFLVGPISVVSVFERIDDYTPGDPTRSFLGDLDGAPVIFLGHDCKNFEVFDIEMYFSAGRISFSDGGNSVTCYSIGEDNLYGETVLVPSLSVTNALSDSLLNLWKFAFQFERKHEQGVVFKEAQDTWRNIYDVIDTVSKNA